MKITLPQSSYPLCALSPSYTKFKAKLSAGAKCLLESADHFPERWWAHFGETITSLGQFCIIELLLFPTGVISWKNIPSPTKLCSRGKFQIGENSEAFLFFLIILFWFWRDGRDFAWLFPLSSPLEGFCHFSFLCTDRQLMKAGALQ